MRHPIIRVLVGAIGLVGAPGMWPPQAEASTTIESSRASIVVRTYTQAGAEGAMRTARLTASAILERAGIEVTWLECSRHADTLEASHACSEPLRRNELVVRIRAAGAAAPRQDLSTLGFAFVDLGADGGSLATVYTDRVQLMAQSAGMDAAELLGRAMAHEIGHLLLGTNRHASRGLMRAFWSNTDLRRRPATLWLFDGRESDVMRQGIASRLAEAR